MTDTTKEPALQALSDAGQAWDAAPEYIYASQGDDGWRYPRASKYPEQGNHENVPYIRADIAQAAIAAAMMGPVSNDNRLIALMVATEEMENQNGWFEHWTNGASAVENWPNSEISGHYDDALSRLPTFKSALMDFLSTPTDALSALAARESAVRDQALEDVIAYLDHFSCKSYNEGNKEMGAMISCLSAGVGDMKGDD